MIDAGRCRMIEADRFKRLLVASALVVPCIPSASVQVPAPGGPDSMLSQQTRPVSSSVVATIFTRQQNLVLLVLWRGEPGWFLGAGRHGGSGGGNANGVFTSTEDYGGIQVSVTYDEPHHEATVQGKAVSWPRDANVILVDGIDAADGPTSIESAVMDPSLDSANPTLASLFSRSASVAAFLRCDVRLQNELTDRTIRRLVCDDLKPN